MNHKIILLLVLGGIVQSSMFDYMTHEQPDTSEENQDEILTRPPQRPHVHTVEELYAWIDHIPTRKRKLHPKNKLSH